MTRSCKRCLSVKDLSDFIKAKGCAFGRAHVCKECRNSRARNTSKSPSRVKKKLETSRDRHLRSKYGLTEDQYTSMFESQKGTCPICNEALDFRSPKTHIDHDHSTGKVRSLLHNTCNFTVGLINENFDTALRLAKYIQEHKGVV